MLILDSQARLRSDHGSENILLALFMHPVQGLEHRGFITGRSVHNQRIERLWGDLFLHLLQHFYLMFYSLEQGYSTKIQIGPVREDFLKQRSGTS